MAFFGWGVASCGALPHENKHARFVFWIYSLLVLRIVVERVVQFLHSQTIQSCDNYLERPKSSIANNFGEGFGRGLQTNREKLQIVARSPRSPRGLCQISLFSPRSDLVTIKEFFPF